MSVATLRPEGQPSFELDGNVRIHRLGGLAQKASFMFRDAERRHSPPVPDPAVLRSLRAVVEEERPEIVHAHNWLVHSFLPLKRRSRARLVVSLHDYSLPCATKRLMYAGAPCSGPSLAKCVSCSAGHYGRIKGPGVALLSRVAGDRLKRQADMFLPVSNAVAEHSALADGDLRYEVMPNFVPDLVQEADSAGDEDRLDELPDGDFALFVGDLSYEKGVEVLLKAHAQLERRLPLVLIGPSIRTGLI